jgi:GT2 family glycosyltransferase
MLLSVVIVNWNSIDDLRACLTSLRAQLHTELELIVVDNGSSDGSPAMVQTEFPEVKLLSQTDNLGFAQACNIGIDASRGEWVAMLNNDTLAQPNWARALVAEIEAAAPDCGMLQSLLLYQDRPEVINSTGIELTYSGGGRDRDGGRAAGTTHPERNLFCPTAGAAAYRRSMLHAIKLPNGYFDPDHFMYYEDLDLGWRARLAGWSAHYVPESVVLHRWCGSSTRHGRGWLVVLSSTNRLRTLVKNASIFFILRTIPRTVLELAKLIWFGRVAGLARLLKALRQSSYLRRSVRAMERLPRRAIERQWTAAPS